MARIRYMIFIDVESLMYKSMIHWNTFMYIIINVPLFSARISSNSFLDLLILSWASLESCHGNNKQMNKEQIYLV